MNRYRQKDGQPSPGRYTIRETMRSGEDVFGVAIAHDSFLLGRVVPVPMKDPIKGKHIVQFLIPFREKYRSRSKYTPHQGKRECARRAG